MTPFIFAQLLKDPNRQEECFKRFIEKNRSKFDETISIRFSTKKYEEVDVSAFFYKDFKEFVIKDLSQVDKDVLFDKWVYDLSERRVKKIRSEVNKELARNLTLKGGASNWGLACEIVYKEYRNIFKEVVSYNYKDDKYKGCKDEIEAILFQRFFLSRVNPGPIESIENYEGWLRACLRNLANRDRPKVDEELGVRDGTIISFDSVQTNSTIAKTNSSESSIEDDSDSPAQPSDISTADEDSTLKEKDNEIQIIDDSGDSRHVDSAIVLLESFLQLLTNPKHIEIIRAIKLEGVPVETLAEDWGCTNAAIYNMMNEAMTALVRVALPVIRKRNFKKYKKCQLYFKENPKDKIYSDYEESILKEFFEDGRTVEELAVEHRKLPSIMASNLRKALDKMYKVVQTLEPEEYLSKDEELGIKKLIDFPYWE